MTIPRPRLPRLPGRRWLIAAATVAFVAAGPAGWSTAQDAESPAASPYRRRTVTARLANAASTVATAGSAAEGDEAAQAERIVASSLAKISRAESVSMRLRQRVRLGDRVLVGAGRYLQAGRGEDQRFRFESRLTCDTESFEMTEVGDGLYCWLHRRIGPDPATLHRIDIRRVRGRLAELGAADPADTAPFLGGMQKILWWARQWFRFTTATAGEVEGEPVWVVTGDWQPGLLPILLPELAAAAKRPEGIRPEDLPDGFPWVTRLSVGRGAFVIRRLEFLAIPGLRPVAATPPEPIVVIDFYETVLDGPVDATAFYYQTASEELVDITEHVVKTMGLMRP